MARMAYSFDSSKCTGCHGCQVSCKQWNQEKTVATKFSGSYQNPPQLDKDTRMIVRYYENFEKDTIPQLNLLKFQCFHCGDAACVKVCPSGALSKTAHGSTAVDTGKCIACGYCHSACPFTIPVVGTHVNKCDMCFSRTQNGSDSDRTSTPACVKTCPAGALEYGNRESLLDQAHKRIAWLKSRGYSQANVYGDNVLGGLGVISILKYPPANYGLPANPSVPSEIIAWKDVFNPFGLVMLAGAMGLTVAHRILVARQNGGHSPEIDKEKGKEEL